MHLLSTFFDTYLQLNRAEEEQLTREVHDLPEEEEVKVMELMNAWEKKGMEKGLQQGLQRGRTEAKLEIAKRLLKMGLAVEDVVKATGLEREEIEQLVGQRE